MYKNNILDGFFKEYDESGKLQREFLHKNGKLDGVRKEYYPNGNLKEEVTCLDVHANIYYENLNLER